MALAPPAFWALDALAPGAFPFPRVFRRVALAAVIVFLALWARRLGVRRFTALGFTRAGWRAGAAWRGALGGAVALAALFALELALGARVFAGLPAAPAVLRALAGGAAIGLVEEGICRGALVFPFGRLRGAALLAGPSAVTALWALAHFLRGGRHAVPVVTWASGWTLWAGLAGAVAASLEAFCGLFAVGLLADRIARRQGHVWGVAGIHAGVAAALQIGGAATAPARPGASRLFTDGLLPGWGVAAMAAVLLAALAARPARAGAGERLAAELPDLPGRGA